MAGQVCECGFGCGRGAWRGRGMAGQVCMGGGSRQLGGQWAAWLGRWWVEGGGGLFCFALLCCLLAGCLVVTCGHGAVQCGAVGWGGVGCGGV